MKRLSDKIVAITGAGGGIGRVAAGIFAKEDATVFILELNEQQGRAAEADILAAGGKAEFYAVDISNEAAVKAVFAAIEEKYGRLDVLYNNASVFWGNRDTVVDEMDMCSAAEPTACPPRISTPTCGSAGACPRPPRVPISSSSPSQPHGTVRPSTPPAIPPAA